MPNDQRIRNAQASQREQIVRQQGSPMFKLRKQCRWHTKAMKLRDFTFIVNRTTAEGENEENEEVSSQHQLRMVVATII